MEGPNVRVHLPRDDWYVVTGAVGVDLIDGVLCVNDANGEMRAAFAPGYWTHAEVIEDPYTKETRLSEQS